jgi:hypothetical protein
MVLNMPIKGRYTLYVNGVYVASSDNMVLDNGLAMMADGVGVTSPVLCVGSSSDAVSSEQIAIGTLLAQAAATGPTLGAGPSREWTTTMTGFTGMVREIGFGKSTTNLFSRSVVAPTHITASDVLTVTYSVSTAKVADLTSVETGHAIFTTSSVTWAAEGINDADILGVVVGMILTGDVPTIHVDHMMDAGGFESQVGFSQVLEWDTVPNDFGSQATVGFTTSRRMGIFHIVGMAASNAVRVVISLSGYGTIILRSSVPLVQEPNPPDFAHTITVNFTWTSA